jgi:hypothetical protein
LRLGSLLLSVLFHKRSSSSLGFVPGDARREGAIGWGAFTPAMSAPSSPKCLHCRAGFVPSPTHRTTQHYCAKPECRKASKAAAQARWRQQPHNCAYFRGPEHVERVRRWRARHPGYWRKKPPALPPAPALALQDLACPQALPAEALTTAPAGPKGKNRPNCPGPMRYKIWPASKCLCWRGLSPCCWVMRYKIGLPS